MHAEKKRKVRKEVIETIVIVKSSFECVIKRYIIKYIRGRVGR